MQPSNSSAGACKPLRKKRSHDSPCIDAHQKIALATQHDHATQNASATKPAEHNEQTEQNNEQAGLITANKTGGRVTAIITVKGRRIYKSPPHAEPEPLEVSDKLTNSATRKKHT